MDEIIEIIKSSLINYFDKLGIKEANIYPYYKSAGKHIEIFSYNSKISFYGDYSGIIYISFSQDIIKKIAPSITRNCSEDYLLDATAEFLNIVSGNVRGTLGNGFNISTPELIKGNLEEILKDNTDIFQIIPILINNTMGIVFLKIK